MRIYDQKYLSVTSVIDLRKPFNKEAFEKWCERVGKDSAMILSTSQILGSKVSEHIDNHTRGLKWLTGPQVDDLERRLLSGADDFVDKWTVLSSEQYVQCEDLHYAGTYDGMIKRGGSVFLADWKTYGAWKNKPYKRVSSKIKKARWQLSLYAHALGWEEGLAVVVFKNDGTWDLEEVEFDTEMVEWVQDNQKKILQVIEEGSN